MTYKMPECKFCGQSNAKVDLKDGMTEIEADELATLSCDCPDARNYQKRQEQAAKAKIELETLMLNDNEVHNIKAVDSEAVELLKKAVDLMADDKIYQISIKLTHGGTAEIKATASGKISVQRSLTLKSKREVE